MNSMLFDMARHEPLTTSSWKADIAEQEITEIINDIEQSILSNASWPIHPLDAESYPKAGPKWSAYAGSAGTIHALKILEHYSYKVRDFTCLLETVHSSFLKSPDVLLEPGLQLGEIGILVPSVLARPEVQKTSAYLLRCIEETIELPFYEITSGQSGMMHAALALDRKTGENCWKNIFIKGAQSLLDNWQQDSDTGEWHWQSQVFGLKRHYYGACHGVAGNANILLQGADLLTDSCIESIIDKTVSTLNISAKTEGNLANWVLCTKPNIDKLLVQWCNGVMVQQVL